MRLFFGQCADTVGEPKGGGEIGELGTASCSTTVQSGISAPSSFISASVTRGESRRQATHFSLISSAIVGSLVESFCSSSFIIA
jgi:hypothetical protein